MRRARLSSSRQALHHALAELRAQARRDRAGVGQGWRSAAASKCHPSPRRRTRWRRRTRARRPPHGRARVGQPQQAAGQRFDRPARSGRAGMELNRTADSGRMSPSCSTSQPSKMARSPRRESASPAPGRLSLMWRVCPAAPYRQRWRCWPGRSPRRRNRSGAGGSQRAGPRRARRTGA